MYSKHLISRLVLLVCIMFVSLGLYGQFQDGQGTLEDPYLVHTATDLDNVRYYLGSYFKQTADIDLSGYLNWDPIGLAPSQSGDTPFNGYYDGAGFIIENLTIDNQIDDFLGLFGYVMDAEIVNVRLENVSVSAAGIGVGALAGVVVESRIRNSSAIGGTVTASNIVGGLVGGIASYHQMAMNNGTYGESAEEEKEKEKFTARSFTEKLLDDLLIYFPAMASKTMQTGPGAAIMHSYADVIVTANDTAGGLLGYQYYAIVEYCYALGDINGEQHIGGLTGTADYGSLTYNSYARGEVTADDLLGGLVGSLYGSYVYSSYSTGEVIENLPTPAVGGLVGYSEQGGSVYDSYWDVETSNQLSSAGGTGKLTSEMTYGLGLNWGYDAFDDWVFFYTWLPDGVPGGLPDHIFPLNDGYPVLVELISGNVMDDYFIGSGTSGDPYEVLTWYHLNLLRNHYLLDKHFIQTSTIDLSTYGFLYQNAGWMPIGNEFNPFKGVYNGDSYEISNLKINRSSTDNVGLFGRIQEESKLSGMILRDVNITGHANVGSLVGSSYDSSITNIILEDVAVKGKNGAGGLLGMMVIRDIDYQSLEPEAKSDVKNIEMDLITVTGTGNDSQRIGGAIGFSTIDVGHPYYDHFFHKVESLELSNVTVSGNTDVGGLFGSAYQTLLNQGSAVNPNVIINSVEVTGSENVGSLAGHYETNDRYRLLTIEYPSLQFCKVHQAIVNGNINAQGNFGGMVGSLINAYVTECQVTGLTMNVNSANNIGGFAGFITDSDIEDCFSVVELDVDGCNNVGGFAGKATWSSHGGDNYPIINSHTEVVMTVSGNAENIGGLVGYSERNDVKNSYAIGLITGSTNIDNLGGLIGFGYDHTVYDSYTTISVHGNDNVGGLVGSSTGSGSGPQSHGYVEGSFATGETVGQETVGGLVGLLNWSRIQDSYSTGNVIGDTKVGGLVGYSNDTSQNKNEIKRSYAIGKVQGNQQTGGLIGLSEHSEIDDTFWDTVTSHQETSAAGTGLMTVEILQDNPVYANWNFSNVWKRDDYTTYPYLRWQNPDEFETAHPDIHNYPPNGYHKILTGRAVYWESFPVMESFTTPARDLLDPFTQVVDTLYFVGKDDWAAWGNEVWHGDNFPVVQTAGFKLEFSNEFNGEYTVPGDGPFEGVDFGTQLVLDGITDHWIGYFIPQYQSALSVFGDMEDVFKVEAETWTMMRVPPDDDWVIPDPPPYLEFGKSYIVHTRESMVIFEWPIPTSPYYPTFPQDPTFFSFQDGLTYEVYNIEYIEDDQDVLEVGVFAGNECVGASVFEGKYPLQVLAYTNPSHLNETISFVVHRAGRRGDRVVRSVEVYDSETGEYNVETLQPLRQRFNIIRLGVGDELVEEETESIVKPIFSLSQNYPNPVIFSSANRTAELTRIDFSLPEMGEVSLNIYNIKGQLVRNLVAGSLTEGKHSVGWKGLNDQNRSVGSGVYFYRLDNGTKVINRKMLIVR